MATGGWVFKSEPDCYSFDDLLKEGKSEWEGVRNYASRNRMMSMKKGDRVFFYHSSCAVPAIVGTCEVIEQSHPDETQFDPQSEYFDPKATRENPRWFLVTIKPIKKFKKPVSLSALRQTPGLENLIVAKRGNRWSITPVTQQEWEIIESLAE